MGITRAISMLSKRHTGDVVIAGIFKLGKRKGSVRNIQGNSKIFKLMRTHSPNFIRLLMVSSFITFIAESAIKRILLRSQNHYSIF